MRGVRVGLVAISLGCMVGESASAQAVSALGRDCAYQQLIAPRADTIPTEWARFLPTIQIRRLEGLPQDAWLAMLDATSASLDSAAGMPGVDRQSITKLQTEITRTREMITMLLSVSDSGQYRALRDSLVRFLGPQVFQPVASLDRMTFFAGTPSAVTIESTTPIATRRAFCYHAAVMSWTMDRYVGDLRLAAVAFIAGKRGLWSRYLVDGHSQLPWELALNSWLFIRKSSSLDPPRSQLVFLHPSVGVEVPAAGFKNLERRESVMLEVVGWLRYGRDHRSYSGVSGVLTITGDVGTGIGPFLYLTPALKGGYVWRLRRDEAGKRGGSAVFGVDLYRLLVDKREMLENQLDAIKKKLPK